MLKTIETHTTQKYFARRLTAVVLAVLTLWSLGAKAQVELYAWDRGPHEAAILIPVPAEISPLEAWRKYVRTIQTELSEFAPKESFVPPTPDSFRPLNYDPSHRSLTLANLPMDLQVSEGRLPNWTRLMGDRQTKNFVLPPAAAISLNEKQRAAFYSEVASHFGLLLPIGGADLDPKLYNETVQGSRNFNGVLDSFERSLIAHYVKAEKGFVYATCRGSQLTAVSLGYRLLQHIPNDVTMAGPHQSVSHDLKIFPTKNNYMQNMWADFAKVSVYSYHHQAVEFKTGGFLELAAISPDGVTEVTEFKNGRGILMQSHPELTLGGVESHGDVLAAKKLFDWLVPQAQKQTRFSCQKLFL